MWLLLTKHDADIYSKYNDGTGLDDYGMISSFYIEEKKEHVNILNDAYKLETLEKKNENCNVFNTK
jgi:hypothetical protein